ncbi:hypothetical protein [Streptomyces sp. NPDC058252]|uniref:hypothetical protein n=1 Tax=Streptomyces sp. NPDC058252 TaxID=3346405 RepID=UPI0036EF092F
MSALLDLDKAIPATPAAVHQALSKTMPGRYTPALADQIAADIVTRLDQLRLLAGRNGGIQ